MMKWFYFIEIFIIIRIRIRLSLNQNCKKIAKKTVRGFLMTNFHQILLAMLAGGLCWIIRSVELLNHKGECDWTPE